MSVPTSAHGLLFWIGLAVPIAAQCDGPLLVPDALVSLDYLGNDVSISGETLVVGAHGTNEVVYVYRRSGRSWFLEQALPSPFGNGATFGFKLNLEEDRLAVGAPGPDSVLIFERTGTTWSNTATLFSSDDVELFGDDVDLDGDRLAVGARGDDDVTTDSGAAYVFEYDGAVWVERAKLKSSFPGTPDSLGRPIAIDGDRVVVGAQSEDFAGLGNSGAIHVFDFDGVNWNETAVFSADGGISGLRFPTSVDLSGDRMVAGALNANGTGTVYVYDFDGTDWVEVQELVPADVQTLDLFGTSLELDGERLAVGSLQSFLGTGRAHVFQEVDGLYVDLATLEPAGAELFDNVGLSCSISGELVASGGWLYDGNGQQDTGALWTWSLDDSLCRILDARPQAVSLSSGGTVRLTLEAGAAAAGARYVVVGSASGTSPGFPLGPLQVPLNPDAYFLTTLVPGASPLGNQFGPLGPAGAATAYFSLPPNSDPSLVGLTLAHAAVVLELDPLRVLDVSNAATFVLEP